MQLVFVEEGCPKVRQVDCPIPDERGLKGSENGLPYASCFLRSAKLLKACAAVARKLGSIEEVDPGWGVLWLNLVQYALSAIQGFEASCGFASEATKLGFNSPQPCVRG